MDSSPDFSKLGLLSWITSHLKDLGFKTPTPVQMNCIPEILKNKNDVLACARTGSGKTATFALPILNELSKDPFGIFAVILSPTQELCHQIAESINLLGRPINVKVVEVLGGQDMVKQASALAKKPHIVVATPGRLADHLRLDTNRIRLSQVKYLVLDEADRLLDRLDSDFEEDLMVLFRALPKASNRQTLMFSATLTDTLKQAQKAGSKPPFIYQQAVDESDDDDDNNKGQETDNSSNDEDEVEDQKIRVPDQLDLKYLVIQENVKDAHLISFLEKYRTIDKKGLIIIFTKTCKNCQILGMLLCESGYNAVMLHSEMRHHNRMQTLNKFKSSNIKILVATDVAARGLDIPNCNLVINHNIPADEKTFVHRVGRTARAGKTGTALSLISVWDIKRIKAIEKFINREFVEEPSDDDKVSKIMVQTKMLRTDCELKLRNNKKLFAKKKQAFHQLSKRKMKRKQEIDEREKLKKSKNSEKSKEVTS